MSTTSDHECLTRLPTQIKVSSSLLAQRVLTLWWSAGRNVTAAWVCWKHATQRCRDQRTQHSRRHSVRTAQVTSLLRLALKRVTPQAWRFDYGQKSTAKRTTSLEDYGVTQSHHQHSATTIQPTQNEPHQLFQFTTMHSGSNGRMSIAGYLPKNYSLYKDSHINTTEVITVWRLYFRCVVVNRFA